MLYARVFSGIRAFLGYGAFSGMMGPYAGMPLSTGPYASVPSSMEAYADVLLRTGL